MKKILILAMLFLTTPCFAQDQPPKPDAPKTPAIPAQPSEAKTEFTNAQNRVCRVTVFSVDHSIPHSARFSDSTLIGEFELKFEGTMIVERFEHKESGVSVVVSLTRYNSALFSKKPMAIRFAIHLSKAPDSYSFNGGAAESIYDKNWRGTAVSSHFRVGDYNGYTFTLACEKRKK